MLDFPELPDWVQAGLLEGNKDAVAYLFKNRYGVLSAFAGKLLSIYEFPSHEVDVDDLINEAAPTFFKKGAFSEKARWTTCVYTILRYRCIDLLRKRAARFKDGSLEEERVSEAASSQYALSGELLRGAVVALTGSGIMNLDKVLADFRKRELHETWKSTLKKRFTGDKVTLLTRLENNIRRSLDYFIRFEGEPEKITISSQFDNLIRQTLEQAVARKRLDEAYDNLLIDLIMEIIIRIDYGHNQADRAIGDVFGPVEYIENQATGMLTLLGIFEKLRDQYPAQALALCLYRILEKPMEEVAQDMGKKKTQVKYLVEKAIAFLGKELGPFL